MNKLIDMVNYFNKISIEKNINEQISNNERHENILANINEYPHAIIFMAIVDSNNRDGFPEALPYEYLIANNDFSFNSLSRLNYDDFKFNMLKTNLKPREEEIKLLYDAIQLIKKDFNSDPSNIWSDCPSSAILKQRLTLFSGINAEKANIISLLLLQKFKIRLADKKDIIISYDNKILATMKRIGLINTTNESYEEIKFITRKLSPEYPGIFDSFFSMIGKYILEGKSSDNVLNASKEIIIEDCIEAVKNLKLERLI